MTGLMLTLLTVLVVALSWRCTCLERQAVLLHRRIDTQNYRTDLLCEEMDALACGLDEAWMKLVGDTWALTEETVIQAITDLANRCATLEARRTLNEWAQLN